MKKLNTNVIYIVEYNPNCEERYLLYFSHLRSNCELFIKKHSYSPYVEKGGRYKYSKYYLSISRSIIDKHYYLG